MEEFKRSWFGGVKNFDDDDFAPDDELKEKEHLATIADLKEKLQKSKETSENWRLLFFKVRNKRSEAGQRLRALQQRLSDEEADKQTIVGRWKEENGRLEKELDDKNRMVEKLIKKLEKMEDDKLMRKRKEEEKVEEMEEKMRYLEEELAEAESEYLKQKSRLCSYFEGLEKAWDEKDLLQKDLEAKTEQAARLEKKLQEKEKELEETKMLVKGLMGGEKIEREKRGANELREQLEKLGLDRIDKLDKREKLKIQAAILEQKKERRAKLRSSF